MTCFDLPPLQLHFLPLNLLRSTCGLHHSLLPLRLAAAFLPDLHDMPPKQTKTCPHCGQAVSSRNFARHKKIIHGIANPGRQCPRHPKYCQICNEYFAKDQMARHFRRRHGLTQAHSGNGSGTECNGQHLQASRQPLRQTVSRVRLSHAERRRLIKASRPLFINAVRRVQNALGKLSQTTSGHIMTIDATTAP